MTVAELIGLLAMKPPEAKVRVTWVVSNGHRGFYPVNVHEDPVGKAVGFPVVDIVVESGREARS